MAGNVFITSKLFRQLFSTAKVLGRSMSGESEILFESVNGGGLITLNRPKALNALNLNMVRLIVPKLKEWEKEKSVVVIKGAGDKAFCAGGDVRAITVAGLKGEQLGQEFFRHEYVMNGIIGTYGVPYVALIDGITMGGGVGLSVHGPYRVATERTLFAMPEMTIGLFPDVGGSHFLPRLGGKLGLYLAMTGHRLKGVDNLRAGIATHYVRSTDIGELERKLLQCKSKDDVEAALKEASVDDRTDFSLKPVLDKIERCFGGRTVEEIVHNLEKDGSQWAQETVKSMAKLCPTSLKITIKQLEYGGKMSLQECLQMEYRIAVNCLNNGNFYEGVRALLIDKDQNPKWNPATLSEVTDEFVDSHFSKLSEEEELKHKL